MNRTLVVMILGALGGFAYASCVGPYCFDDTGASIQARVSNAGPVGLKADTSANILARSGDPVGSMMLCSDCNLSGGGNICLSTTTNRNGYTHYPATSTVCN